MFDGENAKGEFVFNSFLKKTIMNIKIRRKQ